MSRTLPRNAVWVATDGSPAGLPALKQADALARLREASLIVCHVLPEVEVIHPLMPQLGGVIVPGVDQQAVFDAIAKEVRLVTGRQEDEFYMVLEFGRAAAVLAELAEIHDPMMMVVGMSTKDPSTRTVVHSTVDRLVQETSSPVLVAKTSPPSGPVVVAMALSTASESALMTGYLEAQRQQVPLIVVHSIEETPPVMAELAPESALDSSSLLGAQRSATEFIESRLSALGSNAQVRVTVGPPVAAVAWCAKQSRASMVIVSTPRVLGSELEPHDIVAGIVREAPCSVLVVRE